MDKEFYKSKTIWAGAVLMAKAIIYDLIYNQNIQAFTEQFFIGLGLVGLRQAIE